jgi:hypothetical protein
VATANRVSCPRCGFARAKANARGPNVIWCGRCGGLVPVDYRDMDGPYSNDPVRSAIAQEDGSQTHGRTLRHLVRHLKGGL